MHGLTRRPGDGRPRRTRALIGDGPAAFQPLEPRLLLAADVLTYHNDNLRDGANLQETTLTPANVNVGRFGKLGQVAVDGQVYAQPLVKTGVHVPGKGIHNVVYVATEHDSLYAFDATTLAPLWHDSFIDPAQGITPEVSGVDDLTPEIGITSTPVIDPTSHTLYVVSTESIPTTTGRTVVQQLHAVDLGTGKEKLGGPVFLGGTVRGSGNGSDNNRLHYDPAIQNQRPALLLSNGVVYIASSSFGDQGPYHGWVLGYNAQTLKQVSAFADTPNGVMGGIWMSGNGPSVDGSGNIFLSTGNGTFGPQSPDGGDFGNSVVKLVNGGTAVGDSFTPFNQEFLNDVDEDLGSGGVVLLPDQPGPNPHLLVTSGKEGRIYLLNRDNLGKFTKSNDHVVQSLPGALNSSFGTPAYFNGTIFYAGVKDPLKAFSLVNGLLNPTPVSGPVTYGFPGANPSVSAQGTFNGIVWTVNGSDLGGPGVLRAYAASNVSRELYDSALAGTRDQSGTFNKYSTPTIANGKVYVQGKGSLTLFGLLPTRTRVSPHRGAPAKGH